jgi:hypothetical protein
MSNVFCFVNKSRLYIIVAIAAAGAAAIIVGQAAAGSILSGKAEIRSSVLEDFYVQNLREDHPEILDGAIAIDDVVLNQSPKLKEVMQGAFENKDNDSPFPRHYTVEISQTEADAVLKVLENARIIQNTSQQRDYGLDQDVVVNTSGIYVEYNGLYYHIAITKVSPL